MKALEKPKYWNKQWYIEQKNSGRTDQDIADYMYVSLQTVNKWKRELKLAKYEYSSSPARGKYKDMNRVTKQDLLKICREMLDWIDNVDEKAGEHFRNRIERDRRNY